jgi:hypothetical protein
MALMGVGALDIDDHGRLMLPFVCPGQEDRPNSLQPWRWQLSKLPGIMLAEKIGDFGGPGATGNRQAVERICLPIVGTFQAAGFQHAGGHRHSGTASCSGERTCWQSGYLDAGRFIDTTMIHGRTIGARAT